MKSYIISYCDRKYEWNLLSDFIPSLFNIAKFNGTLYILDYGLTKYCVKKLSKFENVVVKKCDKKRSVECNRNYDIFNALYDFPEASVIMSIDCGDVWFQDTFYEIFELCKDRIGYVEEQEKPEDERWWGKIIAGLDRVKYQYACSVLQGHNLSGSGMFIGPKQMMLELVGLIKYWTNWLSSDYFGIDQLAFNIALRTTSMKKISLPQTYDYVFITHKDEASYENGIVYDLNHTPVKIAHNAGGRYRVIDRKKVIK